MSTRRRPPAPQGGFASVIDGARPGIDHRGETGEEHGRDRAARAGPRPGRILLASADPREIRRIRALLAAEPWSLSSASGGEEALRELATGGETSVPDLVLLGLPFSGPYGRLIVATLRGAPRTRTAPVLALTRENDPAGLIEALEAGADQAVVRPFDEHDLLSRIRTLVRLRRLEIAAEESRAARESLEEGLAAVKDDRASFAGRLAHDLKNPLTGIMGNAQMLQMKFGAESPDVGAYAGKVLASAHQIQQLLSDLRDLGLIEEGRFRMTMEAVDLHAAAAMVIQDLEAEAAACGVEIELVPSRPDPRKGPTMVRADAGLLVRLLGNLISSALRHVPSDGRVRVLLGAPVDGRAEIHVSDIAAEASGDLAGSAPLAEAPGRAPEQPEARLHRGLRMAFCRAVVAALEGRIWVKPNATGGSTIGVLLPAERTPAA